MAFEGGMVSNSKRVKVSVMFKFNTIKKENKFITSQAVV